MPLPVQTGIEDEEPVFGERTPFVGGQYVALYYGQTRITTVPNRPAASRSGGTISWSAPANGGSSITEYRVYSPDLVPPVATTASTSITLENGVLAGYRVTAVNAVGESLKSLPVS